MGQFIDMTGKKIGRWLVLNRSQSGKYKNGSVFWTCQCECGAIKSISGVRLRNRTTMSCGCYHRDIMTSHGDNGTDFHNVWGGMKQRCLNENNHAYKDYGGRGISFDPRWEEYVLFKEDMYESYLEHIKQYGKKETTLDRTNNDEDYSPENCRWATHREQQENTRVNLLFEAEYVIPGPSFGYKEQSRNRRRFAKKYGIDRKYITDSLNSKIKTPYKGWVFRYV